MAHLQLTTTLLGLGLAAIILVLLRRDHLHLSHGLFWILVACGSALLGLWPALVDRVGVLVGISYPPTLLLLVVIMVLLVKALYNDILNTRMERQVRRLNQRLAMFEVDHSRNESSHV